MTPLEQYIHFNFGVAGDELTNIASLFEADSLKKNEYYIRSGKVCDKLSFVGSGFLRL